MIALISLSREKFEICRTKITSGDSDSYSISRPRVVVVGASSNTSTNPTTDSTYESITLSMLSEEVLKYFALRNGSIYDDFKTDNLYTSGNLEVAEHTSAQSASFGGDVYLTGSNRGSLGNGFYLSKDSSGISWGEIDNLTVRGTLSVFELLITQIQALKGTFIISPGNGTIESIEETTTRYILTLEDDYSSFAAGDYIRCQISDGTDIRGYWVEAESSVDNTVTILKSEFTNWSTPIVGDEIVQMGNSYNTARQGIIYMSAANDGMPRIEVYNGINSKSLTDKQVAVLGSLDGIEDAEGYGLWSSNAFLTGKMVIGAGSSGLENTTEWNGLVLDIEEAAELAAESASLYTALNDHVDALGESLQDQIDSKVESFFYDYDPTVSNYPASEWDDDEKETHLNDTFTNSDTGYSWRWSLIDSDYLWVKIEDPDAAEALAAAAEAQDTADGKRRVFTDTPYPPYDVGDLWVQGSSGDLMACTTAREEGEYVSSDWSLASKYTDDSAIDSLTFSSTNILDGTSAEYQDYTIGGYFTTLSTTTYSSLGLTYGDTITYRIYIKPTDVGGGRARITYYTSSSTYSTAYGNGISLGGEGYSEATFVIPDDIESLDNNIAFCIHYYENNYCSGQYKEMMVVKSSKIDSSWSPSINDTNESIQDMQDAVDLLSDEVAEAQSSAVGNRYSGINLLAKGKATLGYYLDASGDFLSSSIWGYTDYIEVPEDIYYLTASSDSSYFGLSAYTCYYDEDKVFVASVKHNQSSTTTYVQYTEQIPAYSNIKYMRFSFRSADIGSTMLEWGGYASAWVACATDSEYLTEAFAEDETLITGGTVLSSCVAVRDSTDTIKAGLCASEAVAPFLFAEPSELGYYDSLFRVEKSGTGRWGCLNVGSGSISIKSDDNEAEIRESDLGTLNSFFEDFSTPSFSVTALSASISGDNSYYNSATSGSFTVSTEGVTMQLNDIDNLSIAVATSATSSEVYAKYSLQRLSAGAYANVGTLAMKLAVENSVSTDSTTTTNTKLSLESGNTYRVIAEIYINVIGIGNIATTASTAALTASSFSFSKESNNTYLAPNGVGCIYGSTDYFYAARQSNGSIVVDARSGGAGIRMDSGVLQICTSGTWKTLSVDSSGYVKAT